MENKGGSWWQKEHGGQWHGWQGWHSGENECDAAPEWNARSGDGGRGDRKWEQQPEQHHRHHGKGGKWSQDGTSAAKWQDCSSEQGSADCGSDNATNDESAAKEPAKRGRGRPKKAPVLESKLESPKVPKKRGRPRKQTVTSISDSDDESRLPPLPEPKARPPMPKKMPRVEVDLFSLTSDDDGDENATDLDKIAAGGSAALGKHSEDGALMPPQPTTPPEALAAARLKIIPSTPPTGLACTVAPGNPPFTYCGHGIRNGMAATPVPYAPNGEGASASSSSSAAGAAMPANP